MAFRDQQKLLDGLKKNLSKLTSKEMEEYKMFIKRQKDDEDFDSVSMKRLKELHDKYYERVDKSRYDHFFKKSDESHQ
jgi:hypothetical protein